MNLQKSDGRPDKGGRDMCNVVATAANGTSASGSRHGVKPEPHREILGAERRSIPCTGRPETRWGGGSSWTLRRRHQQSPVQEDAEQSVLNRSNAGAPDGQSLRRQWIGNANWKRTSGQPSRLPDALVIDSPELRRNIDTARVGNAGVLLSPGTEVNRW